ncbi:hypothetical protein HG535_0F00590 [Zygotorulaspora mrakii]|uniref:Mitochondrial group I intron splicing factor CCM1 n=1 Tax=Zygotorulaspora mrakii TaxID=42260 RepID=A0A7H9B6F8_ZYGMR|nr:uncharacterized protein HG535_0F00590 [Zygotorulaspora mrakii]QLG73549.1 hypothetical protein HG535_0F00590 [Zygotorulaspora mrakii]
MIRIKHSLLPFPHALRRKLTEPAIFVLQPRWFSCFKQIDEQRNKDDIANWVRNSLHEPMSSPSPTVNFMHPEIQVIEVPAQGLDSNTISFVPMEEYFTRWNSLFKVADENTIRLVISMIQSNKKAFSLQQLMPLVQHLKAKRRCYEIDTIFTAYQDYFSVLKRHNLDPKVEHLFLEIMISTEATLGNYSLCETLFSDYIKHSKVKPRIISIGLRSFIENGNVQLAKEFFSQAVKNPDTFPMTNKELFLFLRDLSCYNDFASMRFSINLWLIEKCQENNLCVNTIPDFRTLSLLHRTFKLFKDETSLNNLLSNSVIETTGYKESILFQTTEFCQDLRDRSIMYQNIDINEKIALFLEALKGEPLDRRDFYLNLLKTFVSIDDIKRLKYIMTVVQEDRDVPLSNAFHVVIAKCFVNRGLLEHLMEYYTCVRKQGSKRLRLRVGHIRQLLDCALRSYPILAEEMTNELKILLNKGKYLRRLPRLKLLLLEIDRLRTQSMGKYYAYRTRVPKLEYERLGVLRSQILSGDVAGAKSTILENIRQGITPRFDFYFLALRMCLDSDMPSLAKLLDDSCSASFHKIPLKVHITWLRYEIISRYKNVLNGTEMLSSNKIQSLKDQLAEFKRNHESSMNFQNYLQLAQLCVYIRDYRHASALLLEAYGLIDKQSSQQWIMYYMTSLKVHARSYKIAEFQELLKEWNTNPNAKWVTHSCIREIKSLSRLLHRRKDKLDVSLRSDPDSFKKITSEINFLVEKYVNYKFEGLNVMRKLTFFIKRWIEQESEDSSSSARKKR